MSYAMKFTKFKTKKITYQSFNIFNKKIYFDYFLKT